MIIPPDLVDVQLGDYLLGKPDSIPVAEIAYITDNYRQTVGQKQIPLMPDELEAWKSGTNKWNIGETLYASIKVDGEFRVYYYDRRRPPGERSFFASHSTHKITAGLPVNRDLETLIDATPYQVVILAGELFAAPGDPPDFEARARPPDLIHALRRPAEPGALDRVGFRVFDLIRLDKTNWFAQPYAERWKIIEFVFPVRGRLAHSVSRIISSRALKDFYEEVTQQGQEGLVVRNSETFKAYKIKPIHSIDAVIVGAVDGFENSKIRPGQLSSALVALRYPDGKYQLLTKVGSGLTEDQRADLWGKLEFANQPSFVAATPDGRSFHMVRPTVVVEVEYFEMHTKRRDDTPTMQNALEYDAATNTWRVLRPLPFPKVRFPRFSAGHPFRDDKTPDPGNVRVAQVLDLVREPLPTPDMAEISIPLSALLARYVFTKGEVMVRKFLLWRTNKHAIFPTFPDFVLYSLDYSVNRKNNPLTRRVIATNDETQAWALFEQVTATKMSGKGGLLMRGWFLEKFSDTRQPDAGRPLLQFLSVDVPLAVKKVAKKAAKKRAKQPVTPEISPKPIAPAPPGLQAAPPAPAPPKEESPPMQVNATRVPKITDKAIQVENAAKETLWIPRIVIVPSSSAPSAPQDAPWAFTVKGWYAAKDEFKTWAGIIKTSPPPVSAPITPSASIFSTTSEVAKAVPPAKPDVPLVTSEATKVLRVTEKAVFVLNAKGGTLWIPKSVFVPPETVPAAPQETPWSFTVKGWFAAKDEFKTWLAGA